MPDNGRGKVEGKLAGRIGPILRRARGAAALNQPEFGLEVGRQLGRPPVDGGQISEYERGRHMPPADYFLAALVVARERSGIPIELLIG